MTWSRSPLVGWKAEQEVDVCWYTSEDVGRNVPDVMIVLSPKKKKKKQQNQQAEEEVGEEECVTSTGLTLQPLFSSSSHRLRFFFSSLFFLSAFISYLSIFTSVFPLQSPLLLSQPFLSSSYFSSSFFSFLVSRSLCYWVHHWNISAPTGWVDITFRVQGGGIWGRLWCNSDFSSLRGSLVVLSEIFEWIARHTFMFPSGWIVIISSNILT